MSKKSIIKAIGCTHLELVKGDGYLYFVYDNTIFNVYETHSVYTMHLCDLKDSEWIDIGKDFVIATENEASL